MISLTLLLAIVWTHWVSDFVLQSDQMAKGKSSSVKWLSIHVAWYTLPFILVFGFKFAIVNAIAHWAVDFVTSKVTSRLFKAGKNHYFFVAIGFDQAVHLSILVATAYLAVPIWS